MPVVRHTDPAAFLAAAQPDRLFLYSTGSARRYDRVAYRPGDTLVFGPSVSVVNVHSYLFVNKPLTIPGPVTIQQDVSGQSVLYVPGPVFVRGLLTKR